jgi:hypothetical protein
MLEPNTVPQGGAPPSIAPPSGADAGVDEGRDRLSEPSALGEDDDGGEPALAEGTLSFVAKLYRIVSDEALKAVIGWSAAGDSLVVHLPSKFTREVLPRYFRHGNLRSFVRQLNMYGFRRRGRGLQLFEFHHPRFRRGEPDAAGRISRMRDKTAVIQVGLGIESSPNGRDGTQPTSADFVDLWRSQRDMREEVRVLTQRVLLLERSAGARARGGEYAYPLAHPAYAYPPGGAPNGGPVFDGGYASVGALPNGGGGGGGGCGGCGFWMPQGGHEGYVPQQAAYCGAAGAWSAPQQPGLRPLADGMAPLRCGGASQVPLVYAQPILQQQQQQQQQKQQQIPMYEYGRESITMY